MLQEQEKSCALSHNIDWGRDGIIPGPSVTAPKVPTPTLRTLANEKPRPQVAVGASDRGYPVVT